ncbi:potassium channel AKT1 [Naviculisporaceae sp. PSN 640]
MSFGVGIGDIALVTRTAWTLYKSVKESSSSFARLTSELLSLHGVLTETQEFLAENRNHLAPSRCHRLTMLLEGCDATLKELQTIVDRYESLGTQSQRAWDQARFGLKDLSEIRERLVSSLTMLNAFNTAMINSSTTRIEKRLNKFFAEVQAGLREGSVVTTTEDVAETLATTQDVWSEFRRELMDVGITISAAEENRDFIVEKIRAALAKGALEEKADSAATTFPPPSDSGYGSYSGASTVEEETDKNTNPRIRSGSESLLPITAANLAFEEELRHQRAEWQAGLNPLDGGSSDAAGGVRGVSPVPKVRRRTGPVGLVKRWLVHDKAMLEAASDGDVDKVAELISLGMDVNIRDRWGWSPLSMCGYGGHKAVARILLDHGADLDIVDVDGDTPTSLAAQRGHAELVFMFDEERAVRDLRLREEDKEIPRR